MGTQSALVGYSNAIGVWTPAGNFQAVAAIDIDGSVAALVIHSGGTKSLSVGAAGANAGASGGLPAGCFKGGPGRICKAQVTTAGGGSVALLIYDNAAGTATGTVIGVIKATAAVGDTYTFDMPAALGLSIPAQSGAPTITLSYS